MKKIHLVNMVMLFAFTNCTTNHKENMDNNKKVMNNNKVTWFSIPSDDIEKTAHFYATAFDWQIEPLTKEDNSDFD